MIRVLGINGSLRDKSTTAKLVELALEAADSCGAETTMLDLRLLKLPLYEAHEDYSRNEQVQQLIGEMNLANAFILGSPEYHGCMSGATKNFFDHLYRELAGKLFGLVAATGGSQGSGCFDNMRAAVQYCHAWTLPYNISASGRDFDAEGQLISLKVMDRLQRLGRDVAIYGEVLHDRFKKDLENREDKPGFALWV